MKKNRMTIEELRTLTLPVTLECDDGHYYNSMKQIEVLGIGMYKILIRNGFKVELTISKLDLCHYPSQKPEKRTVVFRQFMDKNLYTHARAVSNDGHDLSGDKHCFFKQFLKWVAELESLFKDNGGCIKTAMQLLNDHSAKVKKLEEKNESLVANLANLEISLITEQGKNIVVKELKSRIEKLREALVSIADLDNPDATKPEYWIDDGLSELLDVITTDTEIARTALKEDDERKGMIDGKESENEE